MSFTGLCTLFITIYLFNYVCVFINKTINDYLVIKKATVEQEMN